MKSTVKKKVFLRALKMSAGIIAPACKAAGVGRSTVYNWMNTDAKFKVEYEEILEEQVDHVENALLKRIKDDDTTAIIFYLKCKGKKRGYGEKPEPEQSYNITFERVE